MKALGDLLHDVTLYIYFPNESKHMKLPNAFYPKPWQSNTSRSECSVLLLHKIMALQIFEYV